MSFRRLIPLLLPLAYMGGLHALSSIPGDPAQIPKGLEIMLWVPPNWQNVLHVPVYAGLAWLWRWALSGLIRTALPAVLLAILLTVGFGIFDEWYQLSVPGRYASVTDALLDVAGALLGALLGHRSSVRSSLALNKPQ